MLLNEFQGFIASLHLVPATGGVFNVTMAGELVHSQEETGLFPDEKAMKEAFQEKLARATS